MTKNNEQASFRNKINERRKNDRLNLKDWYVRSLLARGWSPLKPSDFPTDLVEFKKAHVLLRRVIAETRKNGTVSPSTDAMIKTICHNEN